MDYKKNPWPMMLSFLLIYLSLNNHPSLGVDTISANQPLSGDQTIISNGWNFELGFFTPENSSRSNYYIGMWYKKNSRRTIVWVANRETPVSDRISSVLRISDGNLVLFNESQIPIWSTNLSSTSSGPLEAVLQDDGNFVLKDGSANSSKLLWQSFDNPTHTWLPGAKMAYNNRTKQSMHLISWKNSEDPAPGLFNLELQKNTNSYIILWNKSVPYWNSGPWDGKIFSWVPEMRANYIYNFSYVSNENESYFTYLVNDPSIISGFVMDISGQIQQLSWKESAKQWNLFWSQPRTQCEVYAFCGPFGICNQQSLPFCSCLKGFQVTSSDSWNLSDFSAGCARKTSLQCGNDSLANGKRDKFWEMPNMKLPDHPQTVAVGSSSECESTCLNNCFCTAYAYGDHCSIWIGDLLNLQQLTSADTNGGTLYLKLAASELSISPPSKKRMTLLLIIGITSVIVLCASISMCIWQRKMSKRKENRQINKRNQAHRMLHSESHVQELIDLGELKEEDEKGLDLPFYDLESIRVATGNFSDENKLGQGGYGPVYKGKLPSGQEIAVKRLSRVSGQGLKEFKNEVLLIAKLQHRNLVKLHGYCIEGSEKILLYEYMPNKSLDFFIFDQKQSMSLEWEMRFNIILGIARGVLYLHQDSRLRIIHRDLKTSNILLDHKMNPKISDFGLARIVGDRQTEAITSKVAGTYGYISPEYAIDGIFSIKSDVFSFGVVLLEIISGKRNTGFYKSEQAMSLLGYAWGLWTDNMLLDLMDETLQDTCIADQFVKCLNIGLLCVQSNPSDRPTMSIVIQMLDGETVNLPTPKRPAFVVGRDQSSSTSSNKPESINEVTNSLEAR
ncbi:G-type lectin S-receptor-like serine/threonine-protein kinase At4g03230 isoform X2 [Quercus suber]|uniref:G-type lectin S-receptor-like serine/threonine-protein kinase At4g03230 isoform X2 n=1 Tax=Quercus suber TaxID=58331 RepID=UPI0032DEF4B5